jgi:catechol 2,3-dioxygenase
VARLGSYTDGRTCGERDTAHMHKEVIHPAVRVGHVHLRVADLDRALGFYRDALGFRVSADARPAGLDMVLLAAGDYHHHIGLNTWGTAGAPPPPEGARGLARLEVVVPGAAEVDGVEDRARAAGAAAERDGEGLRLRDPSGNRVLVRD